MEIPIKFKTIEKLLKKTYFSNNLNPEMQLSEMHNYTCAIKQCFLSYFSAFYGNKYCILNCLSRIVQNKHAAIKNLRLKKKKETWNTWTQRAFIQRSKNHSSLHPTIRLPLK